MLAQFHRIQSISQLRQVIASPHPKLAQRIIPALDEHCRRLIDQACLLALGCFEQEPSIRLLDLEKHQVDIIDPQRLQIHNRNASSSTTALNNVQASLYFILPGIGYGLRVNGLLSGQKDNLQFDVQSAYLHCTRAKVRADFWMTGPATAPRAINKVIAEHAPIEEFLAASPYLLMLTRNAKGDTELSPRGDPRGFVTILDDGRLIIPERPGNRASVSLLNIIDSEDVSLLFMIPGTSQLLALRGTAMVTDEFELLEPLAVAGKTPALALVVQINAVEKTLHNLLNPQHIWDEQRYLDAKTLPSFPKMMGQHINGKGLKGMVSGLVVDKVVKHGLENLY